MFFILSLIITYKLCIMLYLFVMGVCDCKDDGNVAYFREFYVAMLFILCTIKKYTIKKCTIKNVRRYEQSKTHAVIGHVCLPVTQQLLRQF